MNFPLDLTIVIPTKNEEKNLYACLQAIGHSLAKEIIVLDSGSTDSTSQIAKNFGAQVVQFNWNGKFPKKRNWLLENYNFETGWILFLDADEYITDAFKIELGKALLQTHKVGFWLNYSVHFLGKPLKGGYPLRKLALFRLGAGRYEQINEEQWSRLDMEIHEHPILTGKLGTIKSKIDHRDFRGVSHYVTKHNEYSSWEASRFLTADKIETSKRWTLKQRIKYRLLTSVWVGPIYFIVSFFFLGGFKDGFRGLAFALLKMAYFTQVYCKIVELKAKNDTISLGG